MPRDRHIHARDLLLAFGMTLLGACAALKPFENAPPSSDRPWKAPDMPAYSAALSETEHARKPGTVSIDPRKTYELSELIDLAQRTNPETRVAWERARQAAIAIGLAEGSYFPALAAAATGAVAHVPLPIPQTVTVVPGGVTSDAQFVIPALSLEWLLLDFGRRRALVDAARALTMEATAGFNAKHQQIVFGVTREFHALTAVRGKVAAARASLAAAHSLEDAATARKQNELATLPEVLQAQEETARATYDLEDALAAEHDAHMALLETIGIRPGTPIDIADISQEPLPPALEGSVDEAIDRALAQRPDLIARLASVRAKEAEVRKARADYWPRLVARSAVAGNIGRLKIDDGAYQSVHDLQYDAGFRFEWSLFEGFERRNKVHLAEAMRHEAEDELEHAKDKAVREVWKAYDDTKVALVKHQAAAALLAASEKAWAATLESYQHGLATFPDVRESERRLVQRPRSCQVALRLTHVGKCGEAVLVRLQRGRPCLLGGGEQRRGCLMLGQGYLRVVVRLPDLAYRLVVGVLQLVFGFVLHRLGEVHLVPTLEPLEQRPLEPEACVVLQVMDALIGAVVDLQPPDVAGDRRPRHQARPVVRARLTHLGLLGPHAREPRDQVRALRQRPVDRFVHRPLQGGWQRLLRDVGDVDRRSGADADGLEQRHVGIVLGGEGILEVVGRPRRLLLRLQDLGQRGEFVLLARGGGVLEAVRSGKGRAGGRHLAADGGQGMELARDAEDDLLVLGVEAGGRLHGQRTRRVHEGPAAAEVEQQPLQAERGDDELRVGRDAAGNHGNSLRDRQRHVSHGAGRRCGEGGKVGALRQADGDGGLAGAFPCDARLRVGALREIDQLAQLVGLLRIDGRGPGSACVLGLRQRGRVGRHVRSLPRAIG